MVAHDAVHNEWKEILDTYPPLLTPRQVQEASMGIIKANDVYKRNTRESKHLRLDYRFVGNRVFVTRESLIRVITGKQELPL